MREAIEFRIAEEHARRFLKSDEGTQLDIVPKIELPVDDPRLQEFRSIYQQLLSEGAFLFTAWIPRRRYSPKELESAEIFQLKVSAMFELGDDEHGTLYDESHLCPRCGAGALQVSELALNTSRIPKSKDVARTISGEIVVSQRCWHLVQRYHLTGLELRPVRHIGPHKQRQVPWYQLVIASRPVDISKETRVGIDPFDDDASGRYRCPEGHVIGLNLLSEASIVRSTYEGSDFSQTKQLVGDCRGLLRPEPIRIVSKKAFQMFRRERLKGVAFEVAHLV
jgi:hypothetical protein